MYLSRAKRKARRDKKNSRRFRAFTVSLAILFLLIAGFYYIWDSNWNEKSKLHSGNEHGMNGQQESADGSVSGNAENTEHADSDSSPATGLDSVDAPPDAVTEAPIIRLAFVGDIMLSGRIGELAAKEGYDYPYRHVAEHLQSVDIAVGNLESPITDRGTPYPNKQYTYRTSPDTVPGMKEAGFDVFNLANNHTIDYGMEGLLDTMKYLDEAELGHMGAGHDETEAYQPYIHNVNGMKVAFLGFTNVIPDTSWKANKDKPGLAETYDYSKAVKAIEIARPDVDFVIVMVHWGIERVDTPEPYMINKAHHYIDAGADLVIGSHPHVLQGLELYKDKWIAYSMGNFIFPGTSNPADKETAILMADCDTTNKSCGLRVIPAKTGIGQPVPLEGDDALALLEKLNRLSVGAEVRADGVVVAKQ